MPSNYATQTSRTLSTSSECTIATKKKRVKYFFKILDHINRTSIVHLAIYFRLLEIL